MVKKKLLVLILAYNAQEQIKSVIDRIPEDIWSDNLYDAQVIIIDDCSADKTADVARDHAIKTHRNIKILKNTYNMGYGGNQKLGYTYAIKNGFDIVALLHGDGQYAPEILADLISPIANDQADIVFGSRMIEPGSARKGGMPYYKFIGNIILTRLQNFLLSSNLSEFHSGYRIYSVASIKKVPFIHNSNWFDFDTDIIIQMLDNNMLIKEIPIPTYYGDEICYVNGTKYAFRIICTTILSRLQKYGLHYLRKFDYKPVFYANKAGFDSSHKFVIDNVPQASKVLDIGCGEGHLAAKLKEKQCFIHGCDLNPIYAECFDKITTLNAENIDFARLDIDGYNIILAADLIEHLSSPEGFLNKLYNAVNEKNINIILTTPNIAFIGMRLLLLFGMFNYSKNGILDLTHKRLFTFSSLRKILNESGFELVKIQGIPAPFPIVFGDGLISRFCLKINLALIRILRNLFSYQIGIIAKPLPTFDKILADSIKNQLE
jgi:glycosyltransferase involved in cell wall biosynthesis